MRTYLYAIALKLLAGERRKQHRDSPADDSPPEPSTPCKQETGFWVREAIAKLDASEQEILMLREYEQLSYGEIADLMRLPINTVRSRLFRARMALKDHLDPKRFGQGQIPGGESEPNTSVRSAKNDDEA